MATDFPPTGVCRPELSPDERTVDPTVPPLAGLSVAPTPRTSGQLRPPAIPGARREPRDEALVPGDIPGLTKLGRLGCATGPQIRFEAYGGCKETLFARRLARWKRRGWVGVTRFLGQGANILWLTQKGADALVDGGHATAAELFPRARAVPPKDLPHYLWVVDLTLLAWRGIPLPAATVEPSWQLQRRHDPAPEAIADLLLSTPLRDPGQKNLFAFEVDTGSEGVGVFLAKLEKLERVLRGWAGEHGKAVVMILTRGSGRAATIEKGVAKLGIPVLVRLLPKHGQNVRAALAEVLSRRGKSGVGVTPGAAPSSGTNAAT